MVLTSQSLNTSDWLMRRQPGDLRNMQASHFVYRTQPPNPLFHPRLILARPDMLVLACSGGLLTVHLSLRVRSPSCLPTLDA